MNAVDTRRKKRVRVALVVWLLLALGMLLAPAPREWGAFGKQINSHYDHVRPVLQPVAHIVLMAVGVVLLMRNFSHRPLGWALLISAATAMLCAIAFEMLQSILPSSFARRCDAEDLIPSTAGIFLGGIIGFCQRLKNKDGNR